MLVVVILSNGRVEQRAVEIPVDLDDELLSDLRSRINTAATGLRIADAAVGLGDLTETVEQTRRPTYSVVVASIIEAMSDHRSDERVMVGGTANLARFGDGFEVNVRPLLEALEEQVLLLKLLGEATSPSTLTVRIGSEVPYEGLASTSVVATGYGPGPETLASLGVVGPTRMDYPGAMASVRAVAQYLSKILDEG